MNTLKSILLFIVLAVFTASCENPVSPEDPQCDILLTPKSTELEAGNSTKISAEINGNCSSQKIKWESDNPDVVSIFSSSNNSAEIKAKKEGQATIKVISKEKPDTYSSIKVDVVYTPIIAFLGNKDRNYDLYFTNSNKVVKRFTDHDRQDFEPNWFSDGEKIAFVSNRTDKAHIYSINKDGTNMQNLTSEFEDAQRFAISPNDKWIAFTGKKGGSFDIYKKNINTGEIVQLTQENIPGGSTPGNPTWSPDGDKIAFQTHRDGNWEIYIMNADGSNKQNISNSSSTVDASPSWSPDGDKIVFTRGNFDIREIYLMNPNGSNKEKLTSENDMTSYPSWSPDGDKIIFNKRPPEGGKVGIYMIDKDGSNLETFLKPSDMSIAAQPSWKPKIN